MGILILLIGYIFGSIPFGLLIGKVWAKIDIREFGSGNIGVSNVLRTVGTVPALLTLILDSGKGAIPVLLAMRLFEEPTWWLAAGVAAIVGHNWPVFLHFKGGKGVATTAGVLITLAPLVALILFSIWVVTLALSRYISLSSMVASLILPLLMYFMGFPTPYLGLALLVSFFTIYRHRPNIQRLLAGTENRWGEKGRKN